MLKFFIKARNKKGFTLVELIVVIAILGILAAVAVPATTRIIHNANVATYNANAQTLTSMARLIGATDPAYASGITSAQAATIIADAVTDTKVTAPSFGSYNYSVSGGDITVTYNETASTTNSVF